QLRDNSAVSDSTLAVLERLEIITKKLVKNENDNKLEDSFVNIGGLINDIKNEMSILYPDIKIVSNTIDNFLIWGNLIELQRCYVNLIKNAIEATIEAANNVVKIEISVVDDVALIRIVNNFVANDKLLFQ